jgi:hypothetical protein
LQLATGLASLFLRGTPERRCKFFDRDRSRNGLGVGFQPNLTEAINL